VAIKDEIALKKKGYAKMHQSVKDPKLTLKQKNVRREAEPEWSSGRYYREQEEARRQFQENRDRLLQRFTQEQHSDEEILKFFFELREEYTKVAQTGKIVVITDTNTHAAAPVTKVQELGAQIWLNFIEQALAAYKTSNVPIKAYMAHASNKDKNFEAHLNGDNSGILKDDHAGATMPAPTPIAHSEALQEMQKFLDETSKLTKKNTKSDLMQKYEAALDIIQEQAATMIQMQQDENDLDPPYDPKAPHVTGTLSPLTINLREQAESGNWDNITEHIETLKATVKDITHAKRVQREMYQSEIDQLTVAVEQAKKDDSKLVKAQEILRMGLLVSISDEFDDAARQFLNGEEDYDLKKDHDGGYDAQDDML